MDSSSGQYIGVAGYNSANGQNGWQFDQWGATPNLLPELFLNGTEWALANQYKRIKFYPLLNGIPNVYELAVSNLPCTSISTSGNEVDLFLGTSILTNTQPRLDQIGELNFAANTDVIYSAVQTGCPDNWTKHVASLILATAGITPKQTIYIQIELGGTNSESINSNWCPDYENVTTSAFLNEFCVDRGISKYGGSYINGIGQRSFNVDLLPELIDMIRTGHTKPQPYANISLNNNPNNWYIEGFYMGMINYGKTTTTTRWSAPLLNGNGGTFCTGNTKTQFVCNKVPAGQGWTDVGGSCYHRVSSVPC